MKVKTYYASVDALVDHEMFFNAYARVSQYRRNKVDQCKSIGKKVLSLGAELLLSAALLDIELLAAPLCFKEGEYGKPELVDNNIHFNFSHSGNRVMCTISTKDVGCDVEKMCNIDLVLAMKHLADGEQNIIKMINDPDKQIHAFYRIWTLKESFIKTIGLGLTQKLDSFSIDIGKSITVNQDFDNEQYHFMEYNLGDGYCYAVCSKDPDIERTMVHVDFNELFSKMSRINSV